MVFSYHEKTMTDLHTKMCLDIIFAPHEELDTRTLVDTSKHGVIAEADQMVWDADLKDIWLTPSRWSMMYNQYLDAEETFTWLNRSISLIGRNGRGTAVLRTKVVTPRGGAATGHTNRESRRWGSCMLSVSYKAIPHPTITLHSRTSYLGYLSALDLTVAYVLGRYISEAIQVPLENFHFVWMAESVQYHAFKSLPWLICNPDPDIRSQGRRLLTKKLIDLTPEEQELAQLQAFKISRTWVNKVRREDAVGLTYGEMTYNTYRRVRRRWHTEIFGYKYAKQFEGWSYYKPGHAKEGEPREFFKAYVPLDSCMVSTLTFDSERKNSRFQRELGWRNHETVKFQFDTEANLDACLECGHLD